MKNSQECELRKGYREAGMSLVLRVPLAPELPGRFPVAVVRELISCYVPFHLSSLFLIGLSSQETLQYQVRRKIV